MTIRGLLARVSRGARRVNPTLRTYRLRSALAEAHAASHSPSRVSSSRFSRCRWAFHGCEAGREPGSRSASELVLAYWLMFTVGLEQARLGRFPVALGVWGANILVLTWTIILYLEDAIPRPDGFPCHDRKRRVSVHGRVGRQDLARTDPSDRSIGDTDRPQNPRRFRLSSVLDRYIGALYLRMLGLSLGATYLVFSLIELKDLVDAVVERKQPAILILKYFEYFIPGALVMTLPFAALIAAVITVTVLSRHGELTALKASGMSARRVCLPILSLTLVLCGLLHLIQDRIAPATNRHAMSIKDQIQGRSPRTYGWSPGGRWTFGSDGRLYHYRLFDPQQARFQGLSVFRVDLASARILEQWFCNSARWNGNAWEIEKGWYRTFPEPGAAGDYRRFDREEVSVFDAPDNFARRERTLVAGTELDKQASISDLDDEIAGLARSGYDTTRLRVKYWQKTAAVATPLVTVLLGLPFAFKVGRRGSMYGVGVGLILAIVFWATAAIFNALGLETILPPLLAAWSPNVFYAAAGVYFLLFVPT